MSKEMKEKVFAMHAAGYTAGEIARALDLNERDVEKLIDSNW